MIKLSNVTYLEISINAMTSELSIHQPLRGINNPLHFKGCQFVVLDYLH